MFDIARFAQAHSVRPIDLEEQGYAVIREARDYFAALAVRAALLSHVEEINQDGGDDVYQQLYPFWGGEDDTFNITSTADLALLPNLRELVLFYDDAEEMVRQFAVRGLEAGYC